MSKCYYVTLDLWTNSLLSNHLKVFRVGTHPGSKWEQALDSVKLDSVKGKALLPPASRPRVGTNDVPTYNENHTTSTKHYCCYNGFK